MARSVLDIIIKMNKQGGADQAVKDMVQLKTSILDTAVVAGTFVAAGYTVKKVLDETVGTLVQYAGEVRNVQNATGASAEDASKLIQILDDQKISYEQLVSAIQKNGKAYDFTIAGIAKMSDSYLKLENSQDRAAFMQARFGKQWLDFVPVMQRGGKAILDSADAVEKNLILTQKAVDDARAYEIANDNLSDSFQGLKISIGQDLIPVVNDATNGFNIFFRALQLMNEAGNTSTHVNLTMQDAIAQATQEVSAQQQALMQHKTALDSNTESEKANAEAAKENSAAHQSMLGLISNIANETKSYADKQTELTGKMAENRAEAAQLYPWQKQQLDELNQKYIDLQTTYDQNAAAHSAAMGKIQYDLFVTKISVGGITDAEYDMAQQAGIMFGVFDQQSVTQAKNMNAVADAVNAGRLKVEDMARALDALDKTHEINVVINTINQQTSETRVTTGSGNKYASGTGGWMTVPSGFPNDTYPIWVSSGEQFAVTPQGISAPVPAGPGGGGINIQLIISSPMTIMDEQTARNTLLPFILQGVRDAKARGAI